MDPGEVGDIIFHAEMPMAGAIIWTVDMESTGDLGGVVSDAGVLGTMALPRIMDVVVIADQTRIENEVVSYPKFDKSTSKIKQILLKSVISPVESDEIALKYQL
ncbi:hypothetical protein [Candidatus Scalindua japonica]|nr:hypothetical protein [Candidatus Scalindua japonica]